VEDTILGSFPYQFKYFSCSSSSKDPLIICEGAKKVKRVEFTILDKAAHCRKVIARAPGRRCEAELTGPQGFWSS
jgi:hypothetical protein